MFDIIGCEATSNKKELYVLCVFNSNELKYVETIGNIKLHTIIVLHLYQIRKSSVSKLNCTHLICSELFWMRINNELKIKSVAYRLLVQLINCKIGFVTLLPVRLECKIKNFQLLYYYRAKRKMLSHKGIVSRNIQPTKLFHWLIFKWI